MDAPASTQPDPSIGDLFGRLADDGRAFIKAEGDLLKAIAAHRAGKAKYGIAALAAALFLGNAALIVFLVALMMELALVIGLFFAGLLVAGLVGAAAFFLVRYGLDKVKALSGDAEERRALSGPEAIP